MKQILDWSKPYHRFFEEMSRIPHGSYNEKHYSDYLAEFARRRNLHCKQYEIGNVIIYKDASPGYETHPTIVLQSHIDMVCEKTPESRHDFLKDPLELYIEDGWLHARGTTLGADDGTGAAYMLSVLDSETVKHPPLECIFTVQEETGLHGARALDPEDIKGRRFISLDDGGGGFVTTIASAAGLRWSGTYPVCRTEAGPAGYRLTVGGLSGGHSGECINQEKGNAVKIAARVLGELRKCGELRLSLAEGGSMANAIPRDCRIEFVTELSAEQAHGIVREASERIRKEYKDSDSGLFVTLEPAEITSAWSRENSDHFLDFLLLCPNGMRHKSMSIEGLTTASANLAVVKTKEEQVSVTVSLRAASDSLLEEMAGELWILGKYFGLSGEETSRYPAWEYEETSDVRPAMKEAVKAVLGAELKLLAVHGGLECGVFQEKWPGMDMVTLGPVGKDVHSPAERLDLKSFDDCYVLLTDLLGRL